MIARHPWPSLPVELKFLSRWLDNSDPLAGDFEEASTREQETNEFSTRSALL